MNSYRVAMTGESRPDPVSGKRPDTKLIHVDITVDGRDDMDAKDKAIAYLRRVYSHYDWRADAVNQLATRKPRRA